MCYAKFSELKYDIEVLKNYLANSNSEWKFYGSNQYDAILTKDVYIPEIADQFYPELLSGYMKFAKVVSSGKASCHTDTRNVGVLVPVNVISGQTTIIYERSEKYTASDNLNIDGDEKVKIYKDPVELSRFFLDGAYFLNTSQPHGVENKSSIDRVVLTFSFRNDIDDWDKVMSLHKAGKLIRK